MQSFERAEKNEFEKSARGHLLKTIEIILIPESDAPAKNLTMRNIMYDVEKALSSENTMVDT